MPARVRTGVTVEVDWGAAATDVSSAVISGRVDHGSGESNPNRSTVEVARGSLVLAGAVYAPGHEDALFDVATLSRRAPCRVSLGSVRLWEGWIEEPQSVPRASQPLTRYRLVGKLDEYAINQIDVASSSANLYTDSTLWAAVTGAVPRLTGAAGAGITFAPFCWAGRAFEFASLAALVGGRLVGEDKTGRLTMPTFGRLPAAADQTAVTNVAYLVRAVESDKATDQIRNRLRIPFDLQPATETVGGDNSYSWDALGEADTDRGVHVGASVPPAQSFTQPLPTGTTTFGVMTARIVAAALRVPSLYSRNVFVTSGTTIQMEYADVDITNHVSASIVTNTINGREVATITLAFSDSPVSWTVVERRPRSASSRTIEDVDRNRSFADLSAVPFMTDTFGSVEQGSYTYGTGSGIASSRTRGDQTSAWTRSAHRLTIRFRVEWIQTTPQLGEQAVNNIASQGRWGLQEVVWPVWVTGSGNNARIQADLDDLSAPRTYHDVTLPLWQETAAKSNAIAGLDYGDYLDLGLVDSSRGVDVTAKTVITGRRLEWGATEVPVVRLRCLETGEAGTAPVIPTDVAPGPVRSLTLSPSSTSMAVSWSAPNTGGDAASYILTLTSGGSTVARASVLGTSHTFTGLSASTAYTVFVISRNSAGSGTAVSATATTTATPLAAPGAPTSLVVGTTTAATAPLSWTAPTTGGAVATYRVEWGTGGAYTTGSASVSGTSHTISGLSASTSYNVRVRAQNAAGNSAWLVGTATTTAAPLAAPGPVRGLSLVPTDTTIAASWTAPNTGGAASSYVVTAMAGGSTVATQTVATTSATITGLTASTEYSVSVVARNSAGSSSAVSDTATTLAPPLQVPGAPTSLVVGTTTAATAPLSWTAPTTGGAVATYRVEWGTGGAYTTGSASVSGTSHTISGLSASTSYNVRVRAQNAAGNSAWLVGTATTMAAVSGGPGVPASLTLAAVSASSVRASWTAPTSGGTPDSYQIQLWEDGTWLTVQDVPSGLTMLFTGLMAETTYDARVRSVNDDGTSGWTFASASVDTPAAPAAPGAPTGLTVGAATVNSLPVSWTAPSGGGAVSTYDVEWGTGSSYAVGSASVSGTSHTITGLSASTSYNIRVRAVNAGGNSAWLTGSGTTTAPPLAVPGPPRNVSATADDSETVTLDWDAPNSGGAVASYSARLRRAGTGGWAEEVENLSGTSRTFTGLTAETSYEVEVQAVNASGGSAWIRDTVSTPAASDPTPAPVIAFSYDSDRRVRISWATPTSDSHSIVRSRFRRRNNNGNWATGSLSPRTVSFIIGRSDGATDAETIDIEVAVEWQEDTDPAVWSDWSNRVSFVIPRPAVPGTPTGLTVGTTTDSTAPMSWTAPSGGGPVVSYRLEWGTGGTYDVGFVEVTGTSHTITGLTGGTTYSVRVRAQNSGGNSAWAAGTAITLATATAAPNAPTSLVVGTNTADTVPLSWTAPAAGEPVYTYRVEWGTGGTYTLGNAEVTGTSHTITGLTASTTYNVRVRAQNSAGNSGWLVGTGTTVATATPAPVARFGQYIGSAFSQVRWTAASNTTHQLIDIQIRWNNGGGSWTTIDGTASTRATLFRQSIQGAGTINVQVRAQYRPRTPPRNLVWSEWSNTVSFVFPAPASAQQAGMGGALIPLVLDGVPIMIDGQPVTLES